MTFVDPNKPLPLVSEDAAASTLAAGDKTGHLSQAKQLLQKSDYQKSAYHFYLAGDLAKAAQIYEMIFDYKNAIKAYVKCGQVHSAGELLIRIGERKKAARLFQRAKKYDLAAKYYKETESFAELIDLYEKIGNFYEAFKIAYRMKDIELATKFASKISRSDPNFIHAYIYLMLERLEAKDYPKILEIFDDCFLNTSIRFTGHTLTSCAEILESSGHYQRALDVYYMLINQADADESVQLKIKNLERKFLKNSSLEQIKTYEDRFQILQKIGTGAMGAVYKARDSLTGEWVALKTLPVNQQDEELLRAFIQEGRTVKRLEHPNIIRVFDYGIENDHYFISMEYLEGKSLREVIAQMGAMNMKNFVAVARPLLEALHYAHQSHIIHRDIKPNNVMLLRDRRVKLMDFGISKILHVSDHRSIARGTPVYMSPEQILGITTTRQSDIYSIGVLFYEMLSGNPPFYEGDILHDHIHTPAEALNKIALQVPFPLVNIVMACLAKKPERRPTSVQKILETLDIVERDNINL